MYNSIVISCYKIPVIVINCLPDLVNPLEVLEKYAKYSGFNLENLTYSYVANLSFEELKYEFERQS